MPDISQLWERCVFTVLNNKSEMKENWANTGSDASVMLKRIKNF